MARRVRWDRVAILLAVPVLAMAGTKQIKKEFMAKEKLVVTITEPKAEEEMEEYQSLGTFKITYYCGGECCNGKWAGVTASGKSLEEGMIATDPMFPFGTELYFSGGVNGLMERYIVEDRGSAIKGNHIDVYVPDHKLANELGVVYTEVFTKK